MADASPDGPPADFLELLRRLVEVETPSRDGPAIRRAADLLVPELEEAGAAVDLLDAGDLGVHLRAAVPGREGGGPLLVLGHLDTVHPTGTLSELPFERAGGRIRGPGVYDMKGGVAAAVTALRRLARGGRTPRTDVLLLLTCDEEIGSPDSRPRIEEAARGARAALVLEPPLPGGDCKVRRKGVGGFTVRVRGVPAHAGIEPERGASAVVEAARLVDRLLELEDPEAGTTLNPGVIEGGSATNVVAASAALRVDLRFREREEAERVESAVRALEPVDPRCSYEIEGGVNRWPLAPGPESRALLERAREIAAGPAGIRLEGGETGGASDGNLTAAAGCPTLDGLGIDGAGAHTLDEHILEEDVARRIELHAGLLERL